MHLFVMNRVFLRANNGSCFFSRNIYVFSLNTWLKINKTQNEAQNRNYNFFKILFCYCSLRTLGTSTPNGEVIDPA